MFASLALGMDPLVSVDLSLRWRFTHSTCIGRKETSNEINCIVSRKQEPFQQTSEDNIGGVRITHTVWVWDNLISSFSLSLGI